MRSSQLLGTVKRDYQKKEEKRLTIVVNLPHVVTDIGDLTTVDFVS